MLNKSNDSISKTLFVIIMLCLVCSIIVSAAAVGLKSRQQVQRELDKQRNLLQVVNLASPNLSDDEIKAIFEARISRRFIDLANGEMVSQPETAKMHELTASEDIIKIKRHAEVMEIYVVKDNMQKINAVILPIVGSGLWSTLHAFIALDIDGKTVKGITFYDQKETPGLGGEVENPIWRQSWVGKQVLNNAGTPALRIVKNGAQPNDIFAVDALSGATITSRGVQNMINFWFSEKGFGPFLTKMQEGGIDDR